MRCPICEFENPAGMRFCGSCGHQLDPQTALAEERRVVTALFADVVGFTTLADTMDPEDLRAVISRFYAALTGEIHRFGGTVEKYVGDAALAIFGLPEVHEDDAVRAVRAALAMRGALGRLNDQLVRERGLTLAMRVGINTGEVVAAPKGGGLGEFHLAADAINVAARLQQHGDPGSILIGPRTERLVRGMIESRSLGPLALKGKSQPIPAWEVLGVKTEAVPGAAVGRAPLIGRSHEMDDLLRLYDRVVRDRRPQLVTILGQPGVGKSRLQQELTALLRALDNPPVIRKGRCLPYGDGLAFGPVAEILKQEAQIFDGDTPDVARAKLRTAVSSSLPEDGNQVAAALGLLIGIIFPEATITAYDPKSAREEAFLSWRRYLESRAGAHPVVLVVEDLHWADDGLLDLFDYTAGRLGDVPLLMVCLSRPELLERRPGWGGAAQNSTRIHLPRLRPEDTHRLMSALLPRGEIPDEVAARILETAEGNPFFVEEIIRLLMERGVLAEVHDRRETVSAERVPIPDTVQGVIAARLDRLPEEEKRLLQFAAVVGRIFWVGLLRTLAGDVPNLIPMMDRLEMRDLIRPHATSTLAGDREFIFKHILTREVAYASLPRALRSRVHAQVAGWLEHTAGERTDELVDVLAYHWEAAGDVPRSIEYLIRGADRARQLFANRRAAEFYGRALQIGAEILTDAQKQSLLKKRGEVRQSLGEYSLAEEDLKAALAAIGPTGDRALEGRLRFEIARLHHRRRSRPLTEIITGYEEARRLAADAGDLSTQGLAVLEIASAYWDQSRPKEAERLARQAVDILERLQDHGALAGAMNLLSTVHWLVLDLQGAHDLASRAVGEARRAGDRSREATALSYHGLYTCYSGRMDEGLRLYDQAEKVAEEIGDRRRLMWVHYFRGYPLQMLGRLDRAIQTLEAGRRIARELGYPNPLIAAELTEAYRTVGDVERALETVRGVSTQMASDDTHLPFVLTAEAAALTADGSPESARAVDRAEQALRTPPFNPDLLRGGAWMAHALMTRGDVARGAANAAHIRPLVPAGWLPDVVALTSLTLAAAAVKAREEAEARRWIGEAAAAIDGRRFLTLEAETAVLQAALEGAVGNSHAARHHLGVAQALVETIASGLEDPGARTTFAHSLLALRARAGEPVRIDSPEDDRPA